MTCALDGSRNFALELERVARDAARQQFALIVDELKQEVCVFVVNVFDPELAETAVFLAVLADFRVAEKFDIVSGRSHDDCFFRLDKNGFVRLALPIR